MNEGSELCNNEGSSGNEKPVVLILALSDLSRDPRVMRQIMWLKADYCVVAAGLSPPQDTSVNFAPIGRKKVHNVLVTNSLPHGSQKLELAPTLRRACGQVLGAMGGAFGQLRATVASIPLARPIWRGLKKIVFGKVPFFQPEKRHQVEDQLSRPCDPDSVAVLDERSASDKHAKFFSNKLKAVGEYSSLEGLHPDLIVANDLDCLVLANMLFKSVKVVFDAHEYAPLEYNSSDDYWVNHEQPARIWACERFLPDLSGMSTVCLGIASEFKRNFNIPCAIHVVTNSPLFESISPRQTGSTIKLVHHGIGAPIRKIELMAETVKLLDDRFELYLILVNGDPDYIKRLKSKYSDCSNIYFWPPVPMPDIAKFISQFDIGFFILEPEIFNYEWALPNKFFEFIQGRLGIAVGPSPEMARIVRDHGLGIISPDFTAESMATALSLLSPQDIDEYKHNSDRCAKSFSAESNRETMLAIVRRALLSNALKEGD